MVKARAKAARASVRAAWAKARARVAWARVTSRAVRVGSRVVNPARANPGNVAASRAANPGNSLVR